MGQTLVKPRLKTKQAVERPPLWKVILLNDDFTPRDFVVLVLKAVFRMNESHAYRVMMTAHQKGLASSRSILATSRKLRPRKPPRWASTKAIHFISRPRRSSGERNAALVLIICCCSAAIRGAGENDV